MIGWGGQTLIDVDRRLTYDNCKECIFISKWNNLRPPLFILWMIVLWDMFDFEPSYIKFWRDTYVIFADNWNTSYL